MESIKELKDISQASKRKKHSLGSLGYQNHRNVSIYITKFFLKISGGKIKPNHISIFNILLGLAALILITFADGPLTLSLFFVLFYFSFLLDKVDGEVARYRHLITLRGAYLDEIYHLLVQNGLVLAVGVNRFLATGNNIFLFFGIYGFILFFLVRYIRKIRLFIYAGKYKANKESFTLKMDMSGTERVVIRFLNILPLKICSLARRHDLFLATLFLLAAFCFNLFAVWFWFLIFWLVLLSIYFLRFLFLNYIFINRDIRLIDDDKL